MMRSRPLSALPRASVIAIALLLVNPGSAAAAPADSLAGIVRDTAGRPVDAATVTIAELNRSVTTGPDGEFVFRAVTSGRYRLIAKRLGYATAAVLVTVPTTEPVAMSLAVSPLRLAPVTVTSTRTPNLSLTSPLPVDQVGPDRLRRDAQVSIAHALDGVAGLRDISTGLQVGTPVVRGLEGPNVLVLDNAMRLEDYSWSTEDGPSVDPWLAENVEVIRGPASLLYGSNAIGGVVHIIPPGVPDALGKPSFTHVGGEIYGGTNNAEVGAILRLEGANGGFGWRANGIARTASNFHTPTGNDSTPSGEIYDTGYDSFNGDLAVGLRGDKSSGDARWVHYGGKFGMLDGTPVPEDNTRGPLRKTNDDRIQLGGNLLNGDSRFEVKAQWQRHGLEEVVGDSRAGIAPPEINLELTTTTVDVLWHFDEGDDWAQGTAGISRLYQTNLTSGAVALVPDATTASTGIFVIEQATKGRWSLLMGFRGDLGTIRADSNADLALGAKSRNANAYSGDIGAVYRPVPQLALSLNIGRAFSDPSLQQLYANGELPAEGIYLIGLPTARPQASRDYDAAARWVTPKLTASLSVYRTVVQDYLYFAPTGDSSPVPNDAGGLDTIPNYAYQQTSRATLTGFDLSMDWAATNAFTIRGRYDLVRGTNDAIGQPLPWIPPPRLDLAVEWHSERRTVAYASLGAHVVSKQTRPSPEDGYVPPGYTLYELSGGIGRDLGSRRYQFDVRVTNLFDTAYTEFLSRYKVFAFGQGRNFIFRLSVPM